MELSPPTSYAIAWRERFRRAEDAREALRERALALVPRMADLLVERYGVRRVWIFGSIVEGRFHEGSDIDLAVDALPGGRALFAAGATLEEIARPFRVDLVPLEEAFEDVRSKVLRTGRLIRDLGPP